jgi:hypothetical protein
VPDRAAPDRKRNAAQLRDAIEKGRTGDKIAWLDPAAAPLGTDEEAGGTPPAAEAVARAHRQETIRPAESRQQDGGGRMMMALIVGLALVAIALLLLLVTR